MKEKTDELVGYNYTLEKHLKKLTEQDEEYEVLYSIWDLNKRNLANGLNAISASYPNYSLHDITHSMTVINNIQRFLGETRIKNLSVTDTFLLLMAGLTHDLGMVLTYKITEKEWAKDNIRQKLDYYANSDDSVISSAAKTIIATHEKINNKNAKDCAKDNEKDDDNNNQKDDYTWAIEIKNAVIILTAELLRKKHALISEEYLTFDNEFKELANNFYSEQLPKRFIGLLSKVALLHGQDFDEVISSLNKKANGYLSDYCHPRFIACMLRLGDLLDFDSNRFNLFLNATIKEMPETSSLHKQKHESVQHMLISPSSIEAELDCSDERVYRISRSWFDDLEKEVDLQRKEWTHIAPDDLGGLPPVISKDSIKILYKGFKKSSDLLNLKFTMPQEKIFRILQGGGIYKEPGFAFIREIVQNALDASKIQLCNDLKSGTFETFIKKKYDEILFPDDLPPELYKLYPVELSIKWKDTNKQVLHIECKDKGTGISEKTLLRMTQHVGDSHINDSDYNDLLISMPYWLKPTAAFGVGLQSVFFVASSFEVETNYPGETTKRIIFRSAAENQYCSISEENIKKSRGTTIKIDINKDIFPDVFGTSFSWDILDLDYVNVFNNKDKEILYLAKIDRFVRKTLFINHFSFSYESENDYFTTISDENIDTTKQLSENKDFKYSISHQQGFIVFDIYEKKIGSSISIWFYNQFEINRSQQLIYLRDVQISNPRINYIITAYLGFQWNLNNQKSDEIVDLSRDNITDNGRKWLYKTVTNLFPDILRIIEQPLLQEVIKGESDLVSPKTQYLNYYLTCQLFNIDVNDSSLLEKIEIPIYIASKKQKNINANLLFEKKSLYLIKGYNKDNKDVIPKREQDRIENKYAEILSDKIIIWDSSFFKFVLSQQYICTDIIKYDDDCQIYKLEVISDKSNVITPIDCKAGKKYLKSLLRNTFHKCTKNAIYGIKDYSNIVVKCDNLSGFENFPDYCVCCIYSPFQDNSQIQDLLNKTRALNQEQLYQLIRSTLEKYVSQQMVELIKEINIDKNVSSEDIKSDYIRLIVDFVLFSHEEDKNQLQASFK